MRAVYAFSGDPITNGHLDIVRRAAATYASLTVVVGDNPAKSGRYLFNVEERLALTARALADLENVTCQRFDGLLAEFAYRHGFDVVVRGVRHNGDLEDEMILYRVNHSLHPSVDTVFLPASPGLAHVSSGVVKALVSEGGDVSGYCPLAIKEALERKILGRYTVGIAGGIAAGKSTIAAKLVTMLKFRGVAATHISLDAVGHFVLGTSPETIYCETRRRIVERFGAQVECADGSIDRKVLGPMVFADSAALQELNQLMHEPILARLYDETRTIAKGVLLIEGAILVEANWTKLVNHNLVLVDASEEVRQARLVERGETAESARKKLERQLGSTERSRIMADRVASDNWGQIWEVDTDLPPNLEALADTLQRRLAAPMVAG